MAARSIPCGFPGIPGQEQVQERRATARQLPGEIATSPERRQAKGSSRLRTRHRAGLEFAAWRWAMRVDAAAHLHADAAREHYAARRQPVGAVHPAQPGIEHVGQTGRHEAAGCVIALGPIEIDAITRATGATCGAGAGSRYGRVHGRPMIIRSSREQKKTSRRTGSGVPAGADSHRRTRGGVLCNRAMCCGHFRHAMCQPELPFRINRMAKIDRPAQCKLRRLRPTDRMRWRTPTISAPDRTCFARLRARLIRTDKADAQPTL